MKRSLYLILIAAIMPLAMMGQKKSISPNLFGIFFEDLNYAADGGLYAELVQNRSFEYSPTDLDPNKQPPGGWHYFTAWEYAKDGNAIGLISLETRKPIHENNPHYLVMDVKTVGRWGAGLRNSGYDGMVLRKGKGYRFSVFLRNEEGSRMPVGIVLKNKDGKMVADTTFTAASADWKKYEFVLTAREDADTASLTLRFKSEGRIAIDMVSLMPVDTYKGRKNGLRRDLAETIAALKPAFVRFPGGCLAHGDGIANIYNWKNTIGPVEQRKGDKNIWNYHQSMGLGYFEYLQFCEDIGAKPIPIVAAGVSCQNSARRRGDGQKCIPLEEMDEYIQDILDLIEYCNGPATSEWGRKRAEAGHPEPFNLEYLGVGNEDHITPEFETRFRMIQEAVQAKYPDIMIVGTAGASGDDTKGHDYVNGWRFARDQKVPIVDEHYYQGWKWFLDHLSRYDSYPRGGSKVYVGEYASWGNEWQNALAEAAFMTSLERNGDVVEFASYAPLLGRIGHTQWDPDLIYFDGESVYPTVNYYVQQLFSLHRGDTYHSGIVSGPDGNPQPCTSCVSDSRTGDIIVKMVNPGEEQTVAIDLSQFRRIESTATLTVLSGDLKAKNTRESPDTILPEEKTLKMKKHSNYTMPAHSVSVIRIKSK